MGKYLAVAIICGALFFGYPLAMENTSDACAAFANRAVALIGIPGGAAGPAGSQNFITTAIVRLFGSSAAETYARQKFPNVPPALSCIGLYWQAVLDPDSTRAALGSLQRP